MGPLYALTIGPIWAVFTLAGTVRARIAAAVLSLAMAVRVRRAQPVERRPPARRQRCRNPESPGNRPPDARRRPCRT